MNQLGLNHLVYLLVAAEWTVLLSLLAFAGGSVLGLAIALMRVSKVGTLRAIASGYIQLIQGTPLLILLFLSYFGLGIVGLKLVPLVAAGIRSRSMPVPSGRSARLHRSGAQDPVGGLRLSRPQPAQQYAYVILPQALRIAIPPTVGFVDQKNTSLASVIGFVELARTDRQQLDLRAVRDLLLHCRHLLRAVLPAVGRQPLPREEGQCRKVRLSSASRT